MIHANNGRVTVSVRDLTRRFGHFTAVDSVSFDVHAGEIFGFLGPNGAGKSTTIKMLCGLLRPTSGQASILGFSAFTEQEMIRQSIGYMSQKFSLYDDLTVRENLEFFGSLYGIRGTVLKKRIRESIDSSAIGAMADSLTRDLPAGIKQRLALGAATLHRPEILFLDEPTSGVDPATRQNFWHLIYDYAEQGRTVFVTTHYMDEAEHCARIALIAAGRVIALDTPSTLKKELPYDVYAIDTPDYLGVFTELSRLPRVHDSALFGRSIHILTDRDGNARKAVTRYMKKRAPESWSLRKISATLEDVFVLKTRQTRND